MEQISAPSPPPALIHILSKLGVCAPIVLTASLTIWLVILFLRPRPLSEYLAYVAATLYPFLLGILGATLSAFDWIQIQANQGIAEYSAPYATLLAQLIHEGLVRFGGGIFLTCLFFPLGILALFIRQPK